MRRHLYLRIFTILSLALLLAALAPLAAQAAPTQDSLTITAQGKTVDAAALSSGSRPFVSGAVDQEVSVTYRQETPTQLMTPGDDVGSGAKLYYTIGGADPTTDSERIDLEANSAVPASQITYTGALVPENFTNAGPAALVRFMIQVEAQGDPSGTFQYPASGFYEYRVDRSVPRIQDFSIVFPPDSTVQKPVANTTQPLLEFNVVDNSASSMLDEAAFAIDIDGEDWTDRFTWTQESPWNFRFRVQYGTDDAFDEGDHTLTVVAPDQARNTPPPLVFAVDLTVPAISDVTAEPEAGVEAGDGVIITSRGTPINVTATAEDQHINRNASSVSVAFVNTDLGLISPFFPMDNTTETTWNTPDAMIPMTFPASVYDLAVRIRAVDQGGNAGFFTTDRIFRVDPTAPVVEDDDPGGFIPQEDFEVVATITEADTGLVEEKIFLHFLNVSGNFTANVTSGQSEDGFFFEPMASLGEDRYAATLPEATNGAVITYFVTAEDAAGNNGTSPVRTVTVDGDPPEVEESPRRFYRGASPYEFEVTVTDEGGGVDADGVTLFYSLDGGSSFQIVPMEATVANGSIFRASVQANLDEGDRIHYYYEAFDVAGNVGRQGSESNLLASVIDKTPPTFQLTAPPTAQGPNFTVSWTGQDPPLSSGDPGSGDLTFTLFARVAGDDQWVRVVSDTSDSSLDVCAVAGFTYEFTGFATDSAGNAGTRADQPLGSTELSGTSCPERVVVEVQEPRIGPQTGSGTLRYDAEGGTGTLPVRWTAESTLTLTPSESLSVDILFSPDNGRTYIAVATGLENTGSHNVSMALLPDCTRCLIKVRASTTTDVSAEAESGVFAVFNADPTIDMDGNGLFDAWEVTHFGALGRADPDGDDDDDGLTNRRESEHGTNPFLRDTDGDGHRDALEVKVGTDPLDANDFPTREQARSGQWTHWFWSVPAIWALCALVFFIGLARRW